MLQLPSGAPNTRPLHRYPAAVRVLLERFLGDAPADLRAVPVRRRRAALPRARRSPEWRCASPSTRSCAGGAAAVISTAEKRRAPQRDVLSARRDDGDRLRMAQLPPRRRRAMTSAARGDLLPPQVGGVPDRVVGARARGVPHELAEERSTARGSCCGRTCSGRRARKRTPTARGTMGALLPAAERGHRSRQGRRARRSSGGARTARTSTRRHALGEALIAALRDLYAYT